MSEPRSTDVQRHRDARTRAWLAWTWAAVGLLAGVAVLAYAGDGPVGQTLEVAGVVMLVGVAVAVVTAGLNHGLLRDGARTDLGGPASIATLALAVTLLVGVVASLLVGRPLEWAHLAVLMLVTGAYLALGLLTVGTWFAGRRVIATTRPLRRTRA